MGFGMKNKGEERMEGKWNCAFFNEKWKQKLE
jgi:hypothetical protein